MSFASMTAVQRRALLDLCTRIRKSAHRAEGSLGGPVATDIVPYLGGYADIDTLLNALGSLVGASPATPTGTAAVTNNADIALLSATGAPLAVMAKASVTGVSLNGAMVPASSAVVSNAAPFAVKTAPGNIVQGSHTLEVANGAAAVRLDPTTATVVTGFLPVSANDGTRCRVTVTNGVITAMGLYGPA